MPSALVLSEEIRAEIRRVREHAEKHVISTEQIVRTASRAVPPVGDDPNFVCVVPVGYRCVFSIEQQPVGTCRHLSVSRMSRHASAAPHPVAIEALMKEFGFTCDLSSALSVWREELDGGRVAINVLEKISDEL